MKMQFSLAGSTIAALGISLMAVSCGDENDNSAEASPKGERSPPEAPGADPPAAPSAPGEKPAPAGDLKSQVVGYWGIDSKAFYKAYLANLVSMAEDNLISIPPDMDIEDLKDPATFAKKHPEQIGETERLVASMALQIHEKGKIVFHMIGVDPDQDSTPYVVKSVDKENRTLTVEIGEIGDDLGTLTATFTIRDDTLLFAVPELEKLGGIENFFMMAPLLRIDEADFRKRQEEVENLVTLPTILDPPEDPGPEEEPAVTEEDEKIEPAPEN